MLIEICYLVFPSGLYLNYDGGDTSCRPEARWFNNAYHAHKWRTAHCFGYLSITTEFLTVRELETLGYPTD